jgi:acetyl esterase/lipase
VARKDGDFKAASAGAAKVLEAEYNTPYLNHATMEPQTATARVTDDKVEVWVGTQNGEKKFLSLTTACTNASDVSGICKTASAGTHIDSKDPPFFVSHSDDDPVVPVSQGRLMKTLLEAKNVSVTYREVTGKAHGWHARFDDAEIVAVRDEITAWIKALAAK